MGMNLRRLVPFGLASMMLLLAGCPPQPVLSVTPLALDFGTADTSKTFRLRNQGGGSLTWQVQETLPWLEVQQSNRKQGGLSGTTTTGIEVFELIVDRSQLELGRTTGQILVTSNGGEQAVAVSINQTSPPAAFCLAR